jgi:hypothetical protein
MTANVQPRLLYRLPFRIGIRRLSSSRLLWLLRAYAKRHPSHSPSFTVPRNSNCGPLGHAVTISLQLSTLYCWKTNSAYLLKLYRLQLRVPIAITADGKPAEPEPEKTFVQKYWMHLLGAFLLISTFLGFCQIRPSSFRLHSPFLAPPMKQKASL